MPHSYSSSAQVRKYLCSLLLSALFSIGLITSALANVFEVKNIAVDVKAATATEARKQALAQGERRAFYALIARLTLTEDQERIPEFSNKEIAPYVRDFSVAREKASSVRYIARLNYRFKPDQIRFLLRSYNVPFAETQSKPVAVLPIYEIGASTVLWDEPNPWRAAWTEREAPVGLVPLILPLGDLSDISTIGAAEALAGDLNRLDLIATRYGASSTIVVHNNMTVDPTSGRQMAIVSLLRPGDPVPIDQVSVQYPAQAGETVDDLLARTTEATAQRINNLWKRQNLLSDTGTGILAITVPITGLKDWLQIRDQLGNIGIVRETDIVLMSRDQVRVNIRFAGDVDQLITALEQANLSLLQEAGEWIVMPIGVFQPPKT